MKLIIKGAIYTDGDILLRPHFTGEFYMVDCTEYKTESQMREEYEEKHVREFMENVCLEYKGRQYYECEYSPSDTKAMDLLSDLGELEYFDSETIFE